MPSFDITTGVDLQEVDNALNQARKELENRYDFKGSKWSVDFDRKEGKLKLAAEDGSKLTALWDVLAQKMVKRGVSLKNLDLKEPAEASVGGARREVVIVQGIAQDKAKEIVRFIKDSGLKKVQASIQADTVRVSAPKRDDLQSCIQAIRQHDFGVDLKQGNFRD